MSGAVDEETIVLQYESAGADSAWVIREQVGGTCDQLEVNGDLTASQVGKAKTWAEERLTGIYEINVAAWVTVGPGSLDQTYYVPKRA